MRRDAAGAGMPVSKEPVATGNPEVGIKQGSISRTVATWLGFALLIGLVVFVVLGRLEANNWNPWNDKVKPDLYDLSRSTVALTGLLGAAVAAGIATRRQRSQERAVEISNKTHHLAAETYALELARARSEETRELRSRYASAAEQLGGQSPAVRLAGVYAMASLADDWNATEKGAADAQACVDVLCAYLRTPRAAPQLQPDVEAAADREVKQTIVRIIANHLQDGAEYSWRMHDFDFTGTVFDGDFSFAGCKFDSRVVFARCVFSGQTSFDRVVFAKSSKPSASKVNFDDSTFTGSTSFSACTIERVISFDNVRFTNGTVTFQNAEMEHGIMSLKEVGFEGARVLLKGLTLAGASRIQVQKSRLLAGEVAFSGAILASGTVSFESCQQTDTKLTFSGAQFNGADVTFTQHTLEGSGALDFSEATLRAGEVHFTDCNIAGGALNFGAANFPGGSVVLTRTNLNGTEPRGPWDPGTFSGRWPN